MADEKEVAIKINIEAKSLSSLKAEFKETQKTLQGLDTSSKDYIKTLEKLGGIKDQIGDLNAEIKAFNPEGKVQAFGNVIGGLASGFQAAQGAAALFGAEGEQLQKTLLKVQAASAFADGIKGVVGMGDAFKVLGNIIKANPLILVASIIIGIGAALFALKDKIAIVGKAFDYLADIVNASIQGFKDLTDWIGITSFKSEEFAEKQIKLAEKVGKATEDRYTKEIAIAKAAGQETIDIEIKKQAAIVASLKLQHKDYKEAQDQLLILTIQRNTKIADENEKAYLKRKEQLDKEVAAARALNADVEALRKQDARDEEEARAAKLLQENNDAAARIAANLKENETLKAQNEVRQKKELETEKKIQAEKAALEKEAIQATQALIEGAFAVRLANVQKGSKEEQKILEKQFKVNKGMQIAMATINGIQAIQAIIATAVDPTGVTTAIRIGASAVLSAANIAKIAATKFNSSGGGSESAGSLSSASSGVAIAPPTNSSTQLNADGTIKPPIKQETPIVKAFVTETDITKAQKNISTIEQKAKL